MRSRNPRHVLACAGILLALGLNPAAAREWTDTTFPADLFDTRRYPGMRGVPELDGSNVHNCGNLLLHVTNFGLIGSTPGLNRPWDHAPSAQWPSGSEVEYLWQANLWVGAIRNAEPAVTSGAFPFEFRPGPSELDRIYRTRELTPGGARKPAANADDDNDGATDEDWLDGRDNDGDGLIDEDFAAISNQMFFCEYGDSDPNIKLASPEHVPLDIHVQQSSYCWEEETLDDFIAFEYRIINRGFDPLFDVYVGFFADTDVGARETPNRAQDDWAGFWEGVRTAQLGSVTKTVKVSIGYMFDDDGDAGEAEGYVGLMFLGARASNAEPSDAFVSLHNFRMFSGRASFEEGGEPSNDDEAYRILDGRAPNSLPPADATTGLRPQQLARRADDYRMLVSAGPFPEVQPGDTLIFQSALVVGPGFDGMLQNAVEAQLTFDGAWVDCDHDPSTGVGGNETRVCGPERAGQQLRINPCDPACDPPNGNPNECTVTVPNEGCVWINADCRIEEQTGFRTGVDGKESLVHWLVGTAPPPPRMRLVAHEDRIDLLWDNLSERTPDLRLNVVDFESYRIWRANNWTRPLGTSTAIGPGANLWMLLAEYDLPRNGIGADRGLESIRYRPEVPDAAVDFYRAWFEKHPLLEPPDLPGFTSDQLDTAKALSQGVRYYRFTDPPFKTRDCRSNPDDPNDCVVGRCGRDGCPSVRTARGAVSTRCNVRGECQETSPPPHAGTHVFYSVTATDHKLALGRSGRLEPIAAGLAGSPSSNFVYINPPSAALEPAEYTEAKDRIYVVPNPATRQSLRDWQLDPNNSDPTGVKVEFHHLPRARGKISVFSLAGDLVVELPFDARDGLGSRGWDLISRNGQEVTSGVYLYVVEADDFERVVNKFVVIR